MRPYTIFVDLDGTIVEHNYTPLEKTDAFLPGALERLIAWHDLGHKIVITTARKLVESLETVYKIQKALDGDLVVVYGCTSGVRVLINDRSPEGEDKAFAINVDRDKGLDGVVLE